VQFTDLSTNYITKWIWSFGDGSTSTEKNPVHVYKKQSSYSVKLIAINQAGGSGVTKWDYITVTHNLTGNKTVSIFWVLKNSPFLTPLPDNREQIQAI
jgi:PKD repeat protein